jgi:hypothetical protein
MAVLIARYHFRQNGEDFLAQFPVHVEVLQPQQELGDVVAGVEVQADFANRQFAQGELGGGNSRASVRFRNEDFGKSGP